MDRKYVIVGYGRDQEDEVKTSDGSGLKYYL
jgi:hypothetical protein